MHYHMVYIYLLHNLRIPWNENKNSVFGIKKLAMGEGGTHTQLEERFR